MRYRCYRCMVGPNRFREFEADKPRCPECGAGDPAVVELEDVHFVLTDDAGPIYGALGRQKVACQPRRTHLAPNHLERFVATGHPAAVNCPSCMGTTEWKQAIGALPPHARGFHIDLEGCCG